MSDNRGQAKRQREFYASNPVQKCVVCGRLFVKRRDRVCSVNCLEKAQAEKAD